jgi:hypothetical protein
VLGADAVHTADALDETDGVPVQVVVDDVVGVLKIEALAEDVGGDQDAQLLVPRARAELVVVGLGGETLDDAATVFGVALDSADAAQVFEVVVEVVGRVGILSEDEDLAVEQVTG